MGNYHVKETGKHRLLNIFINTPPFCNLQFSIKAVSLIIKCLLCHQKERLPYKKSGKSRFLERARGGAFLFSWQKGLFLQGIMGKTPVWNIRKARKANLPVG
ncbi:MAG: hypothetical protein ACOCNS_03340 [Bacteroidales bacterium]